MVIRVLIVDLFLVCLYILFLVFFEWYRKVVIVFWRLVFKCLVYVFIDFLVLLMVKGFWMLSFCWRVIMVWDIFRKGWLLNCSNMFGFLFCVFNIIFRWMCLMYFLIKFWRYDLRIILFEYCFVVLCLCIGIIIIFFFVFLFVIWYLGFLSEVLYWLI